MGSKEKAQSNKKTISKTGRPRHSVEELDELDKRTELNAIAQRARQDIRELSPL
jgi:hypothetical protein